MIYLVTGGSGSGKSAYAESLLSEFENIEVAIILPRCRYMEKKAKKG